MKFLLCFQHTVVGALLTPENEGVLITSLVKKLQKTPWAFSTLWEAVVHCLSDLFSWRTIGMTRLQIKTQYQALRKQVCYGTVLLLIAGKSHRAIGFNHGIKGYKVNITRCSVFIKYKVIFVLILFVMAWCLFAGGRKGKAHTRE